MKLIGGYRVPYDPTEDLNNLDHSYDEAISNLWENLYHQGDVDTASYYSVPFLVRRGELSLVGAIEVARNDEDNPNIPELLESDYFEALQNAMLQEPKNQEQCQGYYIIHASINNQKNLAKALHLFSVEEVLDEYA